MAHILSHADTLVQADGRLADWRRSFKDISKATDRVNESVGAGEGELFPQVGDSRFDDFCRRRSTLFPDFLIDHLDGADPSGVEREIFEHLVLLQGQLYFPLSVEVNAKSEKVNAHRGQNDPKLWAFTLSVNPRRLAAVI